MNDLLNVASVRSPLRLLLSAAATVIILAGMKAASQLVGMVLLALLITLLAYPFMVWLRERGLSPRMAYLAAIGVVLLGALIIVLIGVISLAQAASEVPQYVQNFESRLATLDTGSAGDSASDAAQRVLGLLTSTASSLVSLIAYGVFMLITIAYMLAEVDPFSALVQRTLGEDNPRLRRVAESTSSVVTYMSITARINFVIAIADMVLLWAVGVPNVLLWGLVAFLFGFVPYIGYWISFLPPAIIAYGIGGIQAAAAVTIGYFLINGLINQLVAPRLYGKGLNLSVTLTLVSVFFWGWLLGSVGGLLAVPLTAVIRSALLANYPESAWLATILSDNRADPEADEESAGALAELAEGDPEDEASQPD